MNINEAYLAMSKRSLSDIKFGTDGWRGIIAYDFTFENARRCVQGIASYLNTLDRSNAWIVVGYDRRFASEHFARIASEVLVGNGFRVWLTDRATPTPVISYSVLEKRALAGIIITASHNPSLYNGIKIRNGRGEILDLRAFREIEDLIPSTSKDVLVSDYVQAVNQGDVVEFDPSNAYIEHLTTDGLVDLSSIRDAGLRVLVDTMWGNGAGWFPYMLAGGTTKITEIHSDRNPIFPPDEST